jgi:HD-like signal output (HDOD) protein
MSHYRDTLSSRVTNLPALPDVLLGINSLMASDSVSMDAVADLLKGDAALSIRLLRVVNSPFYARQKPVADLLQATVLLGATEISNMARCLAMIDASSAMQAWRVLDSAKYWQGSMAVSAIADLLASKINLPDKVGFAACLSNIGICALADSFADEYREVLEQNTVLEIAERAHFGLDNSDAAKILLAHWEIGDNIAAVNKATIDPRIEQVIEVAKLLTELLAYSSCSRFVRVQNPYDLLASLDLDSEQVNQLIPAIKNAADIGAYSAGGKAVNKLVATQELSNSSDDIREPQMLVYIATDSSELSASLGFLLSSLDIANTPFSKQANFYINAYCKKNPEDKESQQSITNIDSSKPAENGINSVDISEFLLAIAPKPTAGLQTDNINIAANWTDINKGIQLKLSEWKLANKQPDADIKAV